MEYYALVWHYALTKAQTQLLEAIHKRVIWIILNFSRGMPYSSTLFAADLTTLASRWDDFSRKFFCIITKSTSCLHHQLPDPKMETHMKNSHEFTQVQKDIVHLYSMHLATIRTEYKITSLAHHTHNSIFCKYVIIKFSLYKKNKHYHLLTVQGKMH